MHTKKISRMNYVSLRWAFVAERGLSLLVAGGGPSLAALCGPLAAPAPLAAGHRPRAGRLQHRLSSCSYSRALSVGSVFARNAACRDLPGPGSDPYPLHWQENSDPQYHGEKLQCLFLSAGF